MDTTETNLIITENRQNQLWLTINRQQKANALTVGMTQTLAQEIVRAGSDDTVNAIVITGRGERVFSAGLDVREKAPDGDDLAQRASRSMASALFQDAVMTVPKPVVVALNGIASGAGAMIALLADACVASDDAAISLPEIDIGIPSFSGVNILEVIGGRALALDLIQSGRRMSAVDARGRGIICKIAARSELEEIAAHEANMLGVKNRHAFEVNKNWVNRHLRSALAEARDQHRAHRENQ